MQIPNLTVESIRRNASSDSYSRGEEYFKANAVQIQKPSGRSQIEAFVKGSDVIPYNVRIQFDERGVTGAQCTCPYFAGSWCRHIVATLLTYLQQGEERAPVASLLEGLDREALVALIERIVERDPDVGDWISRELTQAR